jgi:hypothetical protein
MSQLKSFADILEAAERLDLEAQAELVAILSRRLAQRGRARVIAEAREARREFAAGQCKVTTPAELMREALS